MLGVSKTLELLVQRGTEFGAAIVRCGATDAAVRLAILRADGRRSTYGLVVEVNGCEVSVRETEPRKLPNFCPERHINSDGTFCMHWNEAGRFKVDSVETADLWWGTLLQFLKLQERAAKLRYWPDDRAWAHGDAAFHQYLAEQSATLISKALFDGVSHNRLSVVRLERRSIVTGPILRLYEGGKLLYSVWEHQKKVLRLRQPCICGTRYRGRVLKLRACGDHAKHAAELAIQIYEKQRAEDRYWKVMAGHPCCGSIAACPLNKAPESVERRNVQCKAAKGT